MEKQELENEILRTRVGGLGSSDAAMVATVGRIGELNETAKKRIAQMLGLEPVEDFTNKFCENGKKREREIFEWIRYENKTSNPKINYHTVTNFEVFCHIDVQVEDEKHIAWYEIKTSKNDADTVYQNNLEQLQWHWMIGKALADAGKKNFTLILLHYHEDYENYCESFDESKITVHTVFKNEPTQLEIHKGLAIINTSLKDFAETYQQREELMATDLPMPMREKLSVIRNYIIAIKEQEKQIEDFKEKILAVMEDKNIKKISTDYLDITYKAPTVRETFESKLFGLEHPELYAKYKKQSIVKSSIQLKIKN